MLRVKGLDHVGLVVADMDRTLRFYQALGLEVLRASGPDASGGRSAVVKAGGQELNVFSRGDLAPIDTGDVAGMHHFCLIMDAASVDEVMAGLRSASIEVVRGPVERRDGTSVFVQDPDGVRVELRVDAKTPSA